VGHERHGLLLLVPDDPRAAVDLESFYALANAALGETPAAIHWDFVLATLQEASGLPQMVGLEVDADVVPPPPPPLPPQAAPTEGAPADAAPAAEPPAPAVPATPEQPAPPQVTN